MRCLPALLLAAAVAVTSAGAGSAQAPGAPSGPAHSYVLTYRNFGPVTASTGFRKADGYEIRFEGCFAKKSAEAICGFTIRAVRPTVISNLANLSHAARADGGELRTCCLFVQGNDQGFPIVKAHDRPGAVATFQQRLAPGAELAIMLRVPDNQSLGPLASITFSRGEGDPGVTFAAHVTQL